jgi:hypothetical protein
MHQGLPARADDLERRRGDLRHARVPVDEHPDSVWDLRRHAVGLQRAEQADDRVRDALAHLGKRAQLGHPCVGETVEAAVHLLEQAAVAEPLEVGPGDPGLVEVASAHRPVPGEAEERGGIVRGGGRHDTKRRLLVVETDDTYHVVPPPSSPRTPAPGTWRAGGAWG